MPRNWTFVDLRDETVVKDDGRYLIYYSWPDDPGDQPAGSPDPEQPQSDESAPPQQPWSPETAPTDV